MTLQPGSQAPYTTAAALITVLDWYRDKAPSVNVDAETVIKAGVAETLATRTVRSLLLLDLIGKDGVPTDQLRELREIKGAEEYRARFQEWLRGTYASVLEFCDPATDSYQRVLEAFRGFQPTGQRPQMVALFLGLWKYAGLPLADAPKGPSPEGATRSQPRTRPPRPAGAKSKRPTTTAAGSGSDDVVGLSPALVGLLRQIPRDGVPWTVEARSSFLKAFEAVLDFTVPIGEPNEIVDSDEEVSP
jgi:hypothetical protein